MATISAWPIDGAAVAQALQKACSKLDGSEPEVVLDFSSVLRLDAGALRALEQLAATAGDKAVTVVLRGVHVDVYKVLKLVKLAPRFSFLA